MATMATKSWHAWRRVVLPPLHGRLLQTWLSAALSTSPQLSSARPCFPQSELPGQTLLRILPFSFSAEVWNKEQLSCWFSNTKTAELKKIQTLVTDGTLQSEQPRPVPQASGVVGEEVSSEGS